MSLDHCRGRDFEVAAVEVVIAEGLRYDTSQLEDFRSVFTANHDMTIVQLDVNVSILVQKVVCTSCKTMEEEEEGDEEKHIMRPTPMARANASF